ncbi:UNVERIFIED_CONTAM: hypothetical protein K2H54_047410 [Gekko kuhli]
MVFQQQPGSHQPAMEVTLDTSEFRLEQLWPRLAGPRALGQKQRALPPEVELQQRVGAFEKDLEETQSDRRSPEAVLQSLLEECLSWQ